ncbi:MAG: pilus assembly protein TadG-related protein, partial [Desulfitobacteriaceae bacterium]
MFYHATKTKDLAQEERGSILVLVALSLSVLLGLSALVTDLGVIYVNYAQLQNALDATVLAGAQELPNSTIQAQQVAKQYASKNGVPEVAIGFDLNNLKISASAQKKVPALFSKILGLTENTITASSRAFMLPPSSLTGVVPLSVKEQNLSYGAEYSLKSGAGGEVDSGWYGALELDGPGAWDYQKFLTYGYSGTLSIGQVLQVE